MKKPALIALLSLGIATLLLLTGIFIGRNSLPATAQPTVTTRIADQIGTESKLLNINSADLWQLQELPGIGEVLAQRILDYRAKKGTFTSLQQLMDVEGIGRSKLENILELICLED